jgi:hypothetical protein
MTTTPISVAPQSRGWQVEFHHAGIWYPIGSDVANFDAAWSALDLLAKSDGDTPVERRIVKFFD